MPIRGRTLGPAPDRKKLRTVRPPKDACTLLGGARHPEGLTRHPGNEVIRLSYISVLAAIIISAFVFGSIVSAAVPAGTEYEKTAGTIGGTVFLDADANGVQDSGEWGMSGVAVHLLDAAGERIATAETFAHACEGLYIFSGVLPGNYTVEIVPPEGYGFTVPGQGAPGATASTVDAANGTTTAIDLTEEVIGVTDLVVRDAGLVPAAA